jgi:hypothetical protein
MVRLAFYGEVNEIGGNKILLEDKDTTTITIFSRVKAIWFSGWTLLPRHFHIGFLEWIGPCPK